ncbi:hypothetical protein C8Q79DRAFT_283359 [Trametes meyenii]|nr:hypothetical protein C8Q79DRAFT_283359 [Trametes meyenii]
MSCHSLSPTMTDRVRPSILSLTDRVEPCSAFSRPQALLPHALALKRPTNYLLRGESLSARKHKNYCIRAPVSLFMAGKVDADSCRLFPSII